MKEYILKRKKLITITSLAICIVIIVSFSLTFAFIEATRFKSPVTAIDPENMGVEERLEDFEYLYNFIDQNWPYHWVKERMHGFNWLDLKSEFETKITNAENNEDFLVVIMEAVEALQNRHTWVQSPTYVRTEYFQFNDWYPMNVGFNKEVAEAAKYWVSLYNQAYERKYGGKFDDLQIVYDRGNYIILDDSGGSHDVYGENSKITKVNGILIDDAIKTIYEKDYIDWDYKREKGYLWRIAPYDFGEDSVFSIEMSNGQEINATFTTIEEYTSDVPQSYPLGVFEAKKYPELSIGYTYFRTFDPSTVQPYSDEILGFYRVFEDYDYLIIDIRGNTGGSYYSWEEFIVKPLIQEDTMREMYLAYRTGDYIQQLHQDYLKDFETVPKDYFDYLPPEVYGESFEVYNYSYTYNPTYEVDFNGEIILLIDPVVYSAAEGFTTFCKQSDFATVYGTPSGGDGIWPFPQFCVLPNSKIVINMPPAMGLDSTGHSSEESRTQPDVYYESEFGDRWELINYVIDDIT